jgi:subtilisin family serine protease
MGGIPAQAWADAVNAAYAAGCCIFAASGDSIGGLPTRFTVYPARFRRVTSVCGVTYGLSPYFNEAYNFSSELEGSFGPDAAMETAMSGFTPNVPWALVSTTAGYSASGGGTSASTPQVAAAAALYIQKNMSALLALPGWQKVEVVRAALFGSAAKGDFSHFGAGFLKANAALAKPVDTSRPQEPPDNLDFALLKELTGWDLMDPTRGEMLMTEMTQLAAKSASIQSMLAGVNITADATTPDIRKSIVDEVLKSGAASQTLTNFLTTARAKM